MESCNRNANVFYKKSCMSRIATRIEARVDSLQENPIAQVNYSGILGETKIWKVFSKQSLALDCAKKTGLELMVFAFEGKAIGEGGRRNFLVCHPKVLWYNTKDRPLASRCIYEVIPKGQVCKLYFDLEFSKEENPNLDGNYLTKVFISVVNYYLLKEFDVKCNFKDILNLESSTVKKFSKHLIYNCTRLLFANNYHAGRFVDMVCNNLRKVALNKDVCKSDIPNVSTEDIVMLFCRAGSSEKLFCDEGVYTKNRNFRIYKSTKYGKQTPLIISQQNEFIPQSGTDDLNYFLCSLVTLVPMHTSTLCYGVDKKTTPSKVSAASTTRERGCSYISPYPEVEMYINNFLGQGCLIKGWQYYRQSEILIFDIDKRYRFCNNIGREHKRNSILYIANLRQEVFYQKCHDPDCKGYQSPKINLPPETMPWKLFTDEFSETAINEELQSDTLNGEQREEEVVCNDLEEKTIEGIEKNSTTTIEIERVTKKLVPDTPCKVYSEISFGKRKYDESSVDDEIINNNEFRVENLENSNKKFSHTTELIKESSESCFHSPRSHLPQIESPTSKLNLNEKMSYKEQNEVSDDDLLQALFNLERSSKSSSM